MARPRRAKNPEDGLGLLLRNLLIEAGQLDKAARLTPESQGSLTLMLKESCPSDIKGTRSDAEQWGQAYQLSGRLIDGRVPNDQNVTWLVALTGKKSADIKALRPRDFRSGGTTTLNVTQTITEHAMSDRHNSLRDPRAQPVTQCIRIGMTGASSVGKSTLALKLKEALGRRPDVGYIPMVDGVGRKLIQAGRSQDRETTFEDYGAYFREHLENLYNQPLTRYVIYTRTFFDPLAYADASGKLVGDWMNMARAAARMVAEKFSVYFYVPVEDGVPLEDDGLRSTDAVFQADLDRAVVRVLGEFVPWAKEVRGTVDERTALALAVIDALDV
jgi:hypothetical protein